MIDIKIERDSISFWLRVKPRAQRDRLKMAPSGDLTLELHAPPVEGEANEALVRFLARALKIPQSGVAIVSGHKARRKLIRITGRAGEEIMAQIKALAGEDTARRAD